MTAPAITVIVPAYNEGAVITETLSPMVEAAASGRVEVIVVPNNCSDDTAARAAAACPAAQVIETATPGKPNAINIGVERAKGAALVFLDADLAVGVSALERLCAPILTGEADASCGRMHVNLDGASWTVRQFYAGWRLNPYHDKGKFGGMFALSSSLAHQIFPIPNVIADDEFISRHAPADRTAFVRDAEFTVFAPRRLSDLIKIRTRSRRGTLELEQMQLDTETRQTGGGALRKILTRAALRPWLWPGVLVYVAVIAYIRKSVRAAGTTSGPVVWERDESSRKRGKLGG